jgi:hypothetical protein
MSLVSCFYTVNHREIPHRNLPAYVVYKEFRNEKISVTNFLNTGLLEGAGNRQFIDKILRRAISYDLSSSQIIDMCDKIEQYSENFELYVNIQFDYVDCTYTKSPKVDNYHFETEHYKLSLKDSELLKTVGLEASEIFIDNILSRIVLKHIVPVKLITTVKFVDKTK